MSWLKPFISFLCIVNLLIPHSSYARWGASRPDVSKYTFGYDELKFIVAYKAYTKAILHIQAAETKKKLICLGYETMAFTNPVDKSVDKKMLNRLSKEIQAYKNSEECREFLKKDVPELVKAYSEMRINLALHQSSNDEIISLTTRFGSFGNIINEPIECDTFPNPLRFGSTNFCFNRIETIMDTTPTHILKKISFKALDSVLDSRELPELAAFPPLTWEEVMVATDIFQGYFTNNPHNLNYVLDDLEENYDQEVLNTITERQKPWTDEILRYHRNQRNSKAILANYYSALDFQAQGAYVFSQYPENSAPRKYTEILAEHPVLAFFVPNYESARLDCDSADMSSYGLTALCQGYKNSLPKLYQLGISFVLKRSNVQGKLAIAYKKVLDLNQLLIQSLDIKYNTQNLFNENGILIKDIEPNRVSNWSDLVSMEVALNNFLDMYPEYHGFEKKFVDLRNTQELTKLVLMIGGAVGAGFACGMMGGWPLVLCLGAAGLGVNVAFYADTLSRHNDKMLKYFSTSTHVTKDGIQLGLIEFESYKSEVQGLLIDTLFLGVGTSAGQMTKLTRELLTTARRGL
jgi:hypothetical protein